MRVGEGVDSLTLLKYTCPVDFDNPRVILVFLVETHPRQLNGALSEQHVKRKEDCGGREGECGVYGRSAYNADPRSAQLFSKIVEENLGVFP